VHEIDTDRYTSKVEVVLDAFQSRFSEFSAEENNVALFTNPFSFSSEKVDLLDDNLQMEVIDLKCNFTLRGRYDELSAVPSASEMLMFWNMLPNENFENLRHFAQRYACRFGSTYKCEQTFSSMKLIKSKNRTRLTDQHLHNLLILATTDLKPNIEELINRIQPQKSH
jgi:hypothetical protein